MGILHAYDHITFINSHFLKHTATGTNFKQFKLKKNCAKESALLFNLKKKPVTTTV